MTRQLFGKTISDQSEAPFFYRLTLRRFIFILKNDLFFSKHMLFSPVLFFACSLAEIKPCYQNKVVFFCQIGFADALPSEPELK